MVAKCGGQVVLTKPVVDTKLKEIKVTSRWSGELEESRKTLVSKVAEWIFPGVVMTKLTMAVGTHTFAATSAMAGAEGIRQGFMQLLDVFTAIAEPILWFYALTACILMATKNKQAGWDRLKQVGYAYAGIALLPTFFAFVRYIAEIIKHSIHF
jgi:Na+/H+-dicarboxylate symporter